MSAHHDNAIPLYTLKMFVEAVPTRCAKPRTSTLLVSSLIGTRAWPHNRYHIVCSPGDT